MWERFSFYGMRGLLIFYLTQHFLFADREAAGIYAAYGSLVYLMPVLGGLIADRFIGFRKAVIFGAILLSIGHFGMAFEGDAAFRVGETVQRSSLYLQSFYFSLAFIIIGVGFLKPSISNIVGQLYSADDPRRDGGFTSFYMGINLGATLAALIAGYLGQTYGWAYGFGLAGVGMLAGLITFVRGQHMLGVAGLPPNPDQLAAPSIAGISREMMIYCCGLLGVLIAWQLMQHRDGVGGLLFVTAVVAVASIIWYSVFRCSPSERDRMLVILFLTTVSVVFWSFFEQAGISIANADGMVAVYWIAFAYFLHTTGELYLSPVGLSMVTRLSVARVTGLMMGVWFLSASFSQYVGGIVAGMASIDTASGASIDRIAALAVYGETFGFLAKIAIAVGLVVMLLAPFVQRFMHECHAAAGSEELQPH